MTDDRLVFQGQVLKEHEERHHDDEKCFQANLDIDPDFVSVRLICDPAIIDDEGEIEGIEPDLFEEGDTVRINVNEIIAVGPSRCCLGEKSEKD